MWLERAKRLAELPQQQGGLFDPYRRCFATLRTRDDPKTVARAGGWRRVKTLMRHYQEQDEAEALRVLMAPARAASGGS